MSGAGGPRLVVEADLTVRVTDPQGRTASVVVDDHDGAVRVRVAEPADLAVLFGSVPLPRAVGRGMGPVLGTLLPGAGRGGPPWDQDVEVFLGPRLMLRRRGGRWRPTSAAVAPVVLGVATALTVVGLLLSLVGRVVRVLLRRRHGGGSTG